MSIITKPSKSVKNKFTCRFVSITVEVNDVRYSVDEIPAGECGSKALRFAKHAGDHEVYDVLRTHEGIVECSCADYESRHRGNGYGMCKHGRSAVELGLMLAPIAPVIPAPATTKPARTVINDAYARDQAALAEFLADSGVEPKPAPAKCCSCSSFSVREENGMPWCDGCYDRMIQTPVVAPCCSPAEPAPCVPCQATTPAVTAADAILAAGLELARADAVNAPVNLPDVFPDECPELDHFEPNEEDCQAAAETFAAADVQRHLDRSGELPLVEAIDHIANAFKGWNNPFGSMLAGIMEELAAKAFMTGATTPAELLTGIATLDSEARATWERAGFEEGRRSVSKPLTDIDSPAARRGKPSAGCAHGNVMPSMTSRY